MNKFWKIVFAISAFAVLLACTQGFVSGQNERMDEGGPSTDRKIEGAWRTTVTPRNCQTGDPVAPAFPGFLVFHQGGTMSGASATVVSADGLWERKHGANNYSFITLSFRYGPNGAFVGTQQISQEITLAQNGNEFTSTGTFVVFDASGAQVQAGCATATGTRFK